LTRLAFSDEKTLSTKKERTEREAGGKNKSSSSMEEEGERKRVNQFISTKFTTQNPPTDTSGKGRIGTFREGEAPGEEE
jgi:hypothetical protein